MIKPKSSWFEHSDDVNGKISYGSDILTLTIAESGDSRLIASNRTIIDVKVDVIVKAGFGKNISSHVTLQIVFLVQNSH